MLADEETGEWVIVVTGGFEIERFFRSQEEDFQRGVQRKAVTGGFFAEAREDLGIKKRKEEYEGFSGFPGAEVEQKRQGLPGANQKAYLTDL